MKIVPALTSRMPACMQENDALKTRRYSQLAVNLPAAGDKDDLRTVHDGSTRGTIMPLNLLTS